VTAAEKLELARAAVEFAEASLWTIHGDGWSVSAAGGGGDIGCVDAYYIAGRCIAGESVEAIAEKVRVAKAKRAAFDAAWNRCSERLRAAKSRYLAARRAAGMPELAA